MAMSKMSGRQGRTETGMIDSGECADAVSVLEHMLDRGSGGGTIGETSIVSWSGDSGRLSDGCTARLGASCMLRPMAGDRVLVWAANQDGLRWVLAVLQRVSADADAVLALDNPLTLQSPKLRLSADSVQISSNDLLVSTRNSHTVAETHSETVRTRVASVGTDIRHATTADDRISGTLMQRAGTWVSSTMREARLRARTFLFD